MAKSGLALWDPNNPALTDADKLRGKLTMSKLRLALGEKLLGKNKSLKSLRSAVNDEVKSIGLDIANAHVKASVTDFKLKLGDRFGVLDRYQIAIYHQKVFNAHGLSKSVYGGTPFEIFGVTPFVEAQANFTNFISSYCDGCDANHALNGE